MATCAQEIQNIIKNNQIETLESLSSNTPLIFSISSSEKKLFTFYVEKQETIRFRVEIIPTNSSINTLRLTISIFSFNEQNGVITNLGSVIVDEMLQEFQKDIQGGTYFLCISNSFSSFDVSLTGFFTGFTPYAKLSLNFFEGSFSSAEKISFPIHERICNKPIRYEIIEGSLPPGLHMNEAGMIYGILPNLDCIDENKNLSPSADWFGRLHSGEWFPWGRQWRFKVRITISGFAQAVDERWFCIRVYNDWDREKENFLNQFPHMKIHEVHQINNEKKKVIELLSQCIPCSTEKEGAPEYREIPDNLCSDCLADVKSNTQAFKLPDNIKVNENNIIAWYQRMKNSVDEYEKLSEDVKRFITELDNSEIFQNILIKKNIIPKSKDINLKNTQFQIKELKGFIMLKQDQLIDGRNEEDIDHQFLMTVNSLNQSLPIEIIAFSGEYSEF